MNLIRKKITNESGSAIVTVLIIISLLTILGTGLLMVSVTGLRRAVVLSGANKAFYLTDGAIEESLAEINEMVFEAEAAANSRVDGAFDFSDENIFEALSRGELEDVFLSNDVWRPFLEKLRDDLQNDTITDEETMEYIEIGLRCEFLMTYYKQLLHSSKSNLTYTLLDEDGDYHESLDNAEAYIEAAIVFDSIDNEALKSEKLLELTTISINDFVSGESGYVSSGGAATNPTMTSVSTSFTENDGILINLRTDGTYNEHRRAIEIQVKVTEPKYTYVFKTAQGNETIYKNELFDYALTSGKDIVAADGSVNVTGNVYAYGTFPETTDEILPAQMGGIAIGYNRSNNDFLSGLSSKFAFDSMLDDSSSLDGALSVAGNLYTRSNVKLYRTGNNLGVTQNLGANGFRTEQNNDNNGDSTINIDGNMYLFEDLVFRGGGGDTNMRIGKAGTDDGDLYLIQNIEGERNEPKDISGALILQSSIADKVRVDLNRLFIGGLAYSGINRQVTDSEGTYTQHFMTGESITVENKYMDFYRSSHAEGVGYAPNLDPYVDTTYYYEVEDSEGNVTVYEFDGFMELDPTIDQIDVSGQRSDNLNFKTEAFYGGATEGTWTTSTGVENEDKEIVTIRSVDTSDDLLENFALGVILGTTNTGTTGVVQPEALMPISDFLDHQVKTVLLNADTRAGKIGRDVDRQMNLLATRDIKSDTNTVYNYVTPTSSSPPDLVLRSTTNSRINQLVDFSSSIEEITYLNNIRIVNPDSSKDIYINPPGAIASNDIALGNGLTNILTDIGGTIATMGDVYVYAPLNTTLDFNGLISAEGRIIFYGPGTKNISLDTNLVHYQVAAYDDMGTAFYKSAGREIVNVGGYYDGYPEIENQFDTSGMSLPRYTVDYGNPPVIAVMPTGDQITVRLDQPPILVGMQKNKGIKGYEIEYWRETRD